MKGSIAVQFQPKLELKKTQIQTIVKKRDDIPCRRYISRGFNFANFAFSSAFAKLKTSKNVGMAPQWVPGVVSVLPVTCTLRYLGTAN